MSLSDLPPPPRPPYGGPRIVTLGGGHGQATLLSALAGLESDLSAVVSIADDGGCSGRLREELQMPPPGDLRRCIASLATESEVAARFEERLQGGDEAGRCVGNLVLAELTQELGSLQLAVDWAAALLGCVGRVVPAAESAGVLTVWDREHGPLAGESLIERSSAAPLVVVVEGPEAASQYAREAIERADVLLLGPGSFVGSTLAVLATGEVVEWGGASRENIGPDWCGLFTGNEGLFGIALEITSKDGFEFSIGSAPAKGLYPVRLFTPDEMKTEQRGGGAAYRQISHVLAPPIPACGGDVCHTGHALLRRGICRGGLVALAP